MELLSTEMSFGGVLWQSDMTARRSMAKPSNHNIVNCCIWARRFIWGPNRDRRIRSWTWRISMRSWWINMRISMRALWINMRISRVSFRQISISVLTLWDRIIHRDISISTSTFWGPLWFNPISGGIGFCFLAESGFGAANWQQRINMANRCKTTQLKLLYLPRDGLEGRHLHGWWITRGWIGSYLIIWVRRIKRVSEVTRQGIRLVRITRDLCTALPDWSVW